MKIYSKLGKIGSMILAMVMLASCTGKPNTPNVPPTTKESDRITETKLPIVKTPLTLTFYFPLDAKAAVTLKNYNEQKDWIELEKRTGIHIDFIHPPSGQSTEQFTLMMASNDLPDIIWNKWRNYPGGPGKAITDKQILALNDIIDKYAPNLTKIYKQNPNMKKDAQLDDNSMYMFPFLRESPMLNAFNGFQLRKDWLDSVNMKVPKTVDEWYTVLKAFASKDPNGNGKPDELPFSSKSSTSSGYSNLLDIWAPAWGVLNDFYINKNGKVSYGPIEPEYRECLITMNKWYQEKLLDFRNDSKIYEDNIIGGLTGSFYGAGGSGLTKYVQTAQATNPRYDLVGAPCAIGPAGKPYTNTNINTLVTESGAAITVTNKHVKETAQWLDYMYSPEGFILMNFGIEGESYKMVNGKPEWLPELLDGSKGLTRDETKAKYAVAVNSGPCMQANAQYTQGAVPQTLNALNLWATGDPSLALPPIAYTQEESTQITSLIDGITKFRKDTTTGFIAGTTSLATFDDYVQKIRKMGLDDILKIQNDALDRYNKRK